MDLALQCPSTAGLFLASAEVLFYQAGNRVDRPLGAEIGLPRRNLRQQFEEPVDIQFEILEEQPFRKDAPVERLRPKSSLDARLDRLLEIGVDLQNARLPDRFENRKQQVARTDDFDLGHPNDHGRAPG